MNALRKPVFLSALALSALLAAVPAGAAAPAQCKELSRKACGASPACTWVDGYVRKDGRKVKAYCRKVSRKSGKAASTKKSAVKAKKRPVADKASKKIARKTRASAGSGKTSTQR